MMKRATIQDVADLAQVSKSAVSRYFNNPKLINQDYAERIKNAIKELNYKPLSSARNLRLGHNNVIGYIMPDISQRFFSSTMKALNDHLFERDCLLISCDTNNDPERERKLINMLIQQDVMALIVVTCGNNTKFLKELAEKFDNLILLIRDEPEVNCDSIHEDQMENSYKLAKHMLEKGCRNFGILYNIPYSSATTQGLAGMQKAFVEFGVEVKNENILDGCKDTPTTMSACTSLLENDPTIDCVIYINQRSAEGTYRAVKSFNSQQHNNVQLAGFTSSTFISTVSEPFPAILEDPIPVANLLADITMRRIFSKGENVQPIKLKLEARANFD